MAVTGGDTNGNDLYIVCTTCHNQHVMNVYSSKEYGYQSTAGLSPASFATIFFVKGPYNPGAPYDPTHVPSTMRFCQQCHFNMSSEYYGTTTVGTAF